MGQKVKMAPPTVPMVPTAPAAMAPAATAPAVATAAAATAAAAAMADELVYRIHNDVLPDEQRRAVNNFLHAGGWAFGWKSQDKTDSFAFWHRHFGGYRPGTAEHDAYDCEHELAAVPIILAFWRHLAEHLLPGHRLIRCYANGAAYGSDGTLHTDSTLPGTYTTIYYPHQRWHPDWGGETVFFNQGKTDIVASVYPHPNRMLMFDGTIPHVARGVSRTCPVLRVTLMFKTDTPDAG
jgi:SM-20-related protein